MRTENMSGGAGGTGTGSGSGSGARASTVKDRLGAGVVKKGVPVPDLVHDSLAWRLKHIGYLNCSVVHLTWLFISLGYPNASVVHLVNRIYIAMNIIVINTYKPEVHDS
jgi:hypothetical protein